MCIFRSFEKRVLIEFTGNCLSFNQLFRKAIEYIQGEPHHTLHGRLVFLSILERVFKEMTTIICITFDPDKYLKVKSLFLTYICYASYF